MTDRVVGIDLSLTCSGVAAITRHGDTTTIDALGVDSTGRKADPLTARHRRVTRLADTVLDYAGAPELAVVEATIAASFAGSSVLDRHALWWAVVGGLLDRGVPVATVVPSSLKKAIADTGKADKAALTAALLRLWPDLPITSSDVSDAAGLAHLGAVHLDWPVPTLDRHRAVAATWPAAPTKETPA